jgi:hypothetical protein
VTNLRRITTILAIAATATTAAACGSSSSQSSTQTKAHAHHHHAARWSGLTHVSVEVSQPSVAPVPGAKHGPTKFTTPAQLKKVTKALNAEHIHKAAHTTRSNACTGGVVTNITIAQHHHGVTHMSSYHCANKITGNIAGNLTGFLKRVDVSKS